MSAALYLVSRVEPPYLAPTLRMAADPFPGPVAAHATHLELWSPRGVATWMEYRLFRGGLLLGARRIPDSGDPAVGRPRRAGAGTP